MKKAFEWSRVRMDEWSFGFLLEVIYRSVVICLLLLIFLRFAVKKGIVQLSIFDIELYLTSCIMHCNDDDMMRCIIEIKNKIIA